MKRCTACFRFHPGTPTFCSYCGRSFDVRICSRGHRNHRGVQFCAECGTADLSTPAPPASWLYHVSGLVLYAFFGFVLAALFVVGVLGALHMLDASGLTPRLAALLVMLGLLYWTTTLLPGRIRRIGRRFGKSGKNSSHR